MSTCARSTAALTPDTSPAAAPRAVPLPFTEAELAHRRCQVALMLTPDAVKPELYLPASWKEARYLATIEAAARIEHGVAFLFLRDEHVLMERCPKKAAKLGIGEWFIPGGKIEPGEAAASACVREVWEELRITVEAMVVLPLTEAAPIGASPQQRFLMRPYLIRRYAGDLPERTYDHDVELRWVPISEALRSPVPQVRMMVAAAMGVADDTPALTTRA